MNIEATPSLDLFAHHLRESHTGAAGRFTVYNPQTALIIYKLAQDDFIHVHTASVL